MPKQLYMATSLPALKQLIFNNSHSLNQLSIRRCCDLANDVHGQARKCCEEGDEERAYVFFMRYMEVVSVIRGRRDYKSDAVFYDMLMGVKNFERAVNVCEKLQQRLGERYRLQLEEEQAEKAAQQRAQQLETGKPQRNTSNSLRHSAVRVNGMERMSGERRAENTDSPTPAAADATTPAAVAAAAASGTNESEISCSELHSVLVQKTRSLLVIDIRATEDYAASHMAHSHVVSVPGHLLTKSLTAPLLERQLPEPHRQLFARRGRFDQLVVLDWTGTSGQLQLLRLALQCWDVNTHYTSGLRLATLTGGYRMWLHAYPMLTTDPHVQLPSSTALAAADTSAATTTISCTAPVDTLLRVQYPSLDDELVPERSPAITNTTTAITSAVAPAAASSSSIATVSPTIRTAGAASGLPDVPSRSLKPKPSAPTTTATAPASAPTTTATAPASAVSNYHLHAEQQWRENLAHQRQLLSDLERLKLEHAQWIRHHATIRDENEQLKAKVSTFETRNSKTSTVKCAAEQSSVEPTPSTQISASSQDTKEQSSTNPASTNQASQPAANSAVCSTSVTVHTGELSGSQSHVNHQTLSSAPTGEENQITAQMKASVNGVNSATTDHNPVSHQKSNSATIPLHSSNFPIPPAPPHSSSSPLSAVIPPHSDSSSLPAAVPSNSIASFPAPATAARSLHPPTAAAADHSHPIPQSLPSAATPSPPATTTSGDHRPIPDRSSESPDTNSINGCRQRLSESDTCLGAMKRSHSSPYLDRAGLNTGTTVSTPKVCRDNKPPAFTNCSTLSNTARERNFAPVHGAVGAALTGLKNLGNTCYMNAVVQCVNNTPGLSDFFVHDHYQLFVNEANAKSAGAVVREMAAVVKTLWSGQFRSIAMHDMKEVMGELHQPFRGFSQHDAHEFLMYLLEYLHEDLNEVKKKRPLKEQENDGVPEAKAARIFWDDFASNNRSFILNLFYGVVKSTVQCAQCDGRSLKFEAFSHLSVPMPDKQFMSRFTLHDCIRLFLSGDVIDGWKCPRCQCLVRATKTLDIWNLPPILVIHLQRFYNDGKWRKKQATVDFPLSGLNMSDYVINQQARYRASEYQLYGVVNHFGSMDGGHYTAFCRHPLSSLWHKFDDRLVSKVRPSAVHTGAGYILFYSAIDSRM